MTVAAVGVYWGLLSLLGACHGEPNTFRIIFNNFAGIFCRFRSVGVPVCGTLVCAVLCCVYTVLLLTVLDSCGAHVSILYYNVFVQRGGACQESGLEHGIPPHGGV